MLPPKLPFLQMISTECSGESAPSTGFVGFVGFEADLKAEELISQVRGTSVDCYLTESADKASC